MKFCFLAEAIVYRYIARAKSEISQKLVGSSGLEPPTSRLSGVRSNHLSYEPMLVYVGLLSSFVPLLVEMNRIELSTPCLQSRCSPS